MASCVDKGDSEAQRYAFLLLKYRPRSRREIRARLQRKNFPASVIDGTISKLEHGGYLDDAQFSRLFTASSRDKGWGRRRIEAHLKKLGVAAKDAAAYLPDKAQNRALLRELIARKAGFYQNKKNGRQKLVRFLAARGFAYDEILEELEEN